MDEDVLAAMAKWPEVPAVFGWMTLTRRGQWLIRGQQVKHPRSLAFIAANYGGDLQGRYYFQNGPQRVYVALERTPWVYRLGPTGQVRTHTDQPVTRLQAAYRDERHELYLETAWGIGLVHDHDLIVLETAGLEADPPELVLAGTWLRLEPIASADLASRFGFCAQPEATPGDWVDPRTSEKE